MRTIPTALAAHLNQEVTSLATVWKIIRQDGVVFRMTDCDVPLTVLGEVYSPIGYSRTAIDTELGTRSDNMNISGFFEATGITQADIDNGLFDFAELRIWIVNHQDTSQGVIALMRGKLGEFEHSEKGLFEATWRSMSEAFRSKLGEKTSATCRVDLGSAACKVPVQPPIVQRGRQYAAGQFVRVATDADGVETFTIPFVNASFEDALGSEWTTSQGFVYRAPNGTSGLNAFDGSYCLRGNTNGALNQTFQDVAFSAIGGLNLDYIDTGRATISLNVRALSDSLISVHKGRVVFETIDADGNANGVLLDTGYKVFYPQRTWVEQGIVDKAIPAMARGVRVTLWMLREEGLDADVCFDLVQGQITTYENGFGFQSSYENRIYECTTPGTTDGTLPAYDTTVGATTTDGGAVFTARQAFTRHATISGVTSRNVFSITVDEARAVDNWFNDGTVTIESGANRGKTIEVKTWIDAGNVVTVFLPFAYDLEVGDRLRIMPGCDKTRVSCRDKWKIASSKDFALGNVQNMRGEPMIPLEETLRMMSVKSLQPRTAASQE